MSENRPYDKPVYVVEHNLCAVNNTSGPRNTGVTAVCESVEAATRVVKHEVGKRYNQESVGSWNMDPFSGCNYYQCGRHLDTWFIRGPFNIVPD